MDAHLHRRFPVFHFVFPRANGTVFHIAIGATDVNAAFVAFAKDWWTPDLGAVGVWMNSALVCRVLPIMQKQTGELEPFMQELRP